MDAMFIILHVLQCCTSIFHCDDAGVGLCNIIIRQRVWLTTLLRIVDQQVHPLITGKLLEGWIFFGFAVNCNVQRNAPTASCETLDFSQA